MYQKYIDMFDAAKAIIFACVKFGVYFGGLYYLLALGYGSKRNEDMIKINERAIKDLERRTLELEKRDNNREESKEPFLMNSWKNKSIEKMISKYINMSDNKLVKTVLDAVTLTGLAAGIGWIARKVMKENFTSDPSSNVMNYAKFTAVMAGSIALKNWHQCEKILPDYV